MVGASRASKRANGIDQDRTRSPAYGNGVLRYGEHRSLPPLEDIGLPSVDIGEVQHEAFRLERLGKGGQRFQPIPGQGATIGLQGDEAPDFAERLFVFGFGHDLGNQHGSPSIGKAVAYKAIIYRW